MPLSNQPVNLSYRFEYRSKRTRKRKLTPFYYYFTGQSVHPVLFQYFFRTTPKDNPVMIIGRKSFRKDNAGVPNRDDRSARMHRIIFLLFDYTLARSLHHGFLETHGKRGNDLLRVTLRLGTVVLQRRNTRKNHVHR